MSQSLQHGVTLVELIVTIAIIGIISAIAFPSYQNYIIKSHRSAAKAQILDIANRQPQFLITNRSYATKAQLEASGYALPAELNGRYTYDIELNIVGKPQPSYRITFTAIGAQVSDGNLKLESDGTRDGKW